MLLLILLIGMLPAFFGWSYVKAQSDAKFKRDETIIENPPYFLGMITAWAWPLQAVFVTLWFLYKLASNAGEGHGLVIDAQKKDMKNALTEFHKYKARVESDIKELTGCTSSNPDEALDLSRQQLNMLTARSIEGALTDESAQRNEDRRIKREAGMDFLRRESIKLKEMGILDQEDDPLPEIFGKNGKSLREKEIA